MTKVAASNEAILVVGSSITGMTAAFEAGTTGYEVHLVEKTGALGSDATTLYKRVPFKAAAPGENTPLPRAEEPGVDASIDQIRDNDNISLHSNSTLTNTGGAPGRFSADISTEHGGATAENLGAIIPASGFQPYGANHLPKFTYGKTPDVLTTLELENSPRRPTGAQ